MNRPRGGRSGCARSRTGTVWSRVRRAPLFSKVFDFGYAGAGTGSKVSEIVSRNRRPLSSTESRPAPILRWTIADDDYGPRFPGLTTSSEHHGFIKSLSPRPGPRLVGEMNLVERAVTARFNQCTTMSRMRLPGLSLIVGHINGPVVSRFHGAAVQQNRSILQLDSLTLPVAAGHI